MTQEKNTVLTPDEQAQIAENLPMLLQAIESGSPIASAWLAQWRSKNSLGEEAADQAEAIRQEVAAAPPEQGTLAQWCGFPTDMTRCSPFFPMNPNELGERRYLEDYLITAANWGEIRYTGPQLSTYEEDALLALLAILDSNGQYKQISFTCEVPEQYNPKTGCFDDILKVYNDEDDVPIPMRKSYTYKGPVLPLLRILHGNRNPTKFEYVRFIKALKRMTVAGVELSISTGKTKSGKHRAPRITQMSAMLAGVHWDDKKKELVATINPFFYEMYMAGRVTLMDVAKRMSLKGGIAKALYRFIQSQKQSVFTCQFLTLADALNMDREQPCFTTRKRLKEAISELVRHGLLMKKSRFMEQDIIRLERAAEAFPKGNKKTQLK